MKRGRQDHSTRGEQLPLPSSGPGPHKFNTQCSAGANALPVQHRRSDTDNYRRPALELLGDGSEIAPRMLPEVSVKMSQQCKSFQCSGDHEGPESFQVTRLGSGDLPRHSGNELSLLNQNEIRIVENPLVQPAAGRRPGVHLPGVRDQRAAERGAARRQRKEEAMSYNEQLAIAQIINIDFNENGKIRSPLREDFFQIVNTERLGQTRGEDLSNLVQKDTHWLKTGGPVSVIPAYSHANQQKCPAKHQSSVLFKKFQSPTKRSHLHLKETSKRLLWNQRRLQGDDDAVVAVEVVFGRRGGPRRPPVEAANRERSRLRSGVDPLLQGATYAQMSRDNTNVLLSGADHVGGPRRGDFTLQSHEVLEPRMSRQASGQQNSGSSGQLRGRVVRVEPIAMPSNSYGQGSSPTLKLEPHAKTEYKADLDAAAVEAAEVDSRASDRNPLDEYIGPKSDRSGDASLPVGPKQRENKVQVKDEVVEGTEKGSAERPAADRAGSKDLNVARSRERLAADKERERTQSHESKKPGGTNSTNKNAQAAKVQRSRQLPNSSMSSKKLEANQSERAVDSSPNFQNLPIKNLEFRQDDALRRPEADSKVDRSGLRKGRSSKRRTDAKASKLSMVGLVQTYYGGPLAFPNRLATDQARKEGPLPRAHPQISIHSRYPSHELNSLMQVTGGSFRLNNQARFQGQKTAYVAGASINVSNDTRTHKIENTAMQTKSEQSNLRAHEDLKEPQMQELAEQGDLLALSVTRALYATDPSQAVKTCDDFNPQLKDVREIAKLVDGISPSTLGSPAAKTSKGVTKAALKRRPAEAESKIKVELNPLPPEHVLSPRMKVAAYTTSTTLQEAPGDTQAPSQSNDTIPMPDHLQLSSKALSLHAKNLRDAKVTVSSPAASMATSKAIFKPAPKRDEMKLPLIISTFNKMQSQMAKLSKPSLLPLSRTRGVLPRHVNSTVLMEPKQSATTLGLNMRSVKLEKIQSKQALAAESETRELRSHRTMKKMDEQRERASMKKMLEVISKNLKRTRQHRFVSQECGVPAVDGRHGRSQVLDRQVIRSGQELAGRTGRTADEHGNDSVMINTSSLNESMHETANASGEINLVDETCSATKSFSLHYDHSGVLSPPVEYDGRIQVIRRPPGGTMFSPYKNNSQAALQPSFSIGYRHFRSQKASHLADQRGAQASGYLENPEEVKIVGPIGASLTRDGDFQDSDRGNSEEYWRMASNPQTHGSHSSIGRLGGGLPFIDNLASSRRLLAASSEVRSGSNGPNVPRHLPAARKNDGAHQITENILRGNLNQSRIVMHLLHQSKRHKLHALSAQSYQAMVKGGDNSRSFAELSRHEPSQASTDPASGATCHRFGAQAEEGPESDQDVAAFNQYVVTKLKESRLSIKKRIEKLKTIASQQNCSSQPNGSDVEQPSARSRISSSSGKPNLDVKYNESMVKLATLKTPTGVVAKPRGRPSRTNATQQFFESYRYQHGRKAPTVQQQKEMMNADIDHVTLQRTSEPFRSNNEPYLSNMTASRPQQPRLAVQDKDARRIEVYKIERPARKLASEHRMDQGFLRSQAIEDDTQTDQLDAHSKSDGVYSP